MDTAAVMRPAAVGDSVLFVVDEDIEAPAIILDINQDGTVNLIVFTHEDPLPRIIGSRYGQQSGCWRHARGVSPFANTLPAPSFVPDERGRVPHLWPTEKTMNDPDPTQPSPNDPTRTPPQPPPGPAPGEQPDTNKPGHGQPKPKEDGDKGAA